MRIVGVIDVRGGRAVHAVAGQRTQYAPVRTAAGMPVQGDPGALARAYVNALGVREVYVADLDAIERGVDAVNRDAVAAIVNVGAPVWLDIGMSSADDARVAVALGASMIVVGLETLARFEALDEICAAVGPDRVAFSIDLRSGQPIVPPNVAHGAWPVTAVAARAETAGVRSIIVLDLARVGTSSGIDVELMTAVRRVAPGVALFAGGGVRSEADIDVLRDVGCDGALIATALLRGTLQPERVRGERGTSRTDRNSPRSPSRSR